MWSEDDGGLSSAILEVDYGYAVLTGVTRVHDIGRWTESEIQRRDWIQCREWITVQATVQASGGMDASRRANTAALQVSDGVKQWLSGAMCVGLHPIFVIDLGFEPQNGICGVWVLRK